MSDDPYLGLHPLIALELRERALVECGDLAGLLWAEILKTGTTVVDLREAPLKLRCALHAHQRGRRYAPPRATYAVVDTAGWARRYLAVCEKHARWVERKIRDRTWQGLRP